MRKKRYEKRIILHCNRSVFKKGWRAYEIEKKVEGSYKITCWLKRKCQTISACLRAWITRSSGTKVTDGRAYVSPSSSTSPAGASKCSATNPPHSSRAKWRAREFPFSPLKPQWAQNSWLLRISPAGGMRPRRSVSGTVMLKQNNESKKYYRNIVARRQKL